MSETKKTRPPGVTVTWTKDGGIRLRAPGPNAPDLRTVLPGRDQRIEPRRDL